MAKSVKKSAKKQAKKPVSGKKTVASKKGAAKVTKAAKQAKLIVPVKEVIIESKEDLKAFNAETAKVQTSDDLLNSAFSGLDTSVVDAEEIAGMLEKFGLRWNVAKKESRDDQGNGTGHFYLQREDKGTIFTVPVKDGYEVFQNSKLAEVLIRIADKAGFEVHAGGMFQGGQRVFMQIDTGNELKNLGENRDTVKGYATGINYHGGGALKFGACDITISCSNTFAMAKNMLQESLMHTQSIHRLVEAGINKILGIADGQKTTFAEYVKLSNIEVTAGAMRSVVESVTGFDVELSEDRNKEKGISKIRINQTGDLLASIAHETREKGNTLWGLFSGVTHYTNYKFGKEERRSESLYLGEANDINNDAYIHCLEAAGIEL